MGIKILIVVTCSFGFMNFNIALITKLNLEARFGAYLYYFSLFELRYFYARTISNLLLDKHTIRLNVDINAHIIQYNTFTVFKSLN